MLHSFNQRPKNKYGAKPKVVDGIRFASILEAQYYTNLRLRKKAGEVLFFHMQVPIRLPGGTIYRVDFQEFHSDGTVHYVDTKGKETESFKIKKREVEAIYPFEIEVVNKAS